MPNRGASRSFFRFGLRSLLLVMLVCCLAARLDPLDWRSAFPAPRPIKTVPLGETAEVDVIELNHRPYTPAEMAQHSGAKGFDQLIFWSYYPDGQLHIRGWSLVRDASMRAEREDGLWICEWAPPREFDWSERVWKQGALCRVRAPKYRETTAYSDHDPEILVRKHLPKQNRIPLWR